jgi:apolipoprotein D and lipocalin family protein
MPMFRAQSCSEKGIELAMRTAPSIAIIASLVLVLGGCAALSRGPVGNRAVPQPAKSVELDRYLGRWYEIARYEASFQRGCEAVTADYSWNGDGSIRVLNSCRQGSVDGKLKTATGKAKIADSQTQAKLRVSFFGPFYGDYWVLDHADDYSWSIVGEPSGRYLWLLAREARPDPAMRSTLESRAKALGYDWSLVRVTRH